MSQPNDNLPDPSADRPVEQQTSVVLAHATITRWDGPLPPPEALQMYEETLSGTAERLLIMAEEQHRHRINQEQRALELSSKALETARMVRVSDSRRGYLGVILGFVIAMIGLLGGIFLVALGRGGFGLTLGLASLAGLVAVFVYGAQSRRTERRRNAESAGAE